MLQIIQVVTSILVVVLLTAGALSLIAGLHDYYKRHRA